MLSAVLNRNVYDNSESIIKIIFIIKSWPCCGER